MGSRRLRVGGNVLAPDPTWQERLVKEWEGAIWVPDHHDERTGVSGCYGPSR